MAVKLTKSHSYQPPARLLSSLASWPGLTLSPVYLVPQLASAHDEALVPISDFIPSFSIDPAAMTTSFTSNSLVLHEEGEELSSNIEELTQEEQKLEGEFSFSRLSDIGGDGSWSKNTSKYRVFSLLKSIADASDWDFPASDSTDKAGMPSPQSLHSFIIEAPDQTSDSHHSLSTLGDVDEGEAQVSTRLFLQGTASHNKLQAEPIVFFKCPPKVIVDASVLMVSHSIISPQETVARDYVGSPLYRRLAVCRQMQREKVEVHFSCCFTGYLTAVGLEFSNLPRTTRAYVNYDIERVDFAAFFHSSALSVLVSNQVLWLACGHEHCLAITASGQVCTWGNGNSGCLGHGDCTHKLSPTVVETLAGVVAVYGDCGAFHCAIVTSEGELWTWGRGDAQQLGHTSDKMIKDEVGWMTTFPQPVLYCLRKELAVRFVACGEAHTLLLDSTGTVYGCGWCEEGQVGRPSTGAEVVSCRLGKLFLPSTDPIVKVVAGSLHSAALSQSGKIYIWGNGKQGQLGLGNSHLVAKAPMVVSTLDDKFVIDIVAGESSMLCLTADYSVYGWGKGVAGVFGRESMQFPRGSELVCFLPRQLGELCAPQRFLASKMADVTQVLF